MNTSIKTLLKECEHALITYQGLMAYDTNATDINNHFKLDDSELLEKLDYAIKSPYLSNDQCY
jgi:hypothetical protein